VTLFAFFSDSFFTSCLWQLLKPVVGIGLILGVYFQLARGVRSFGEPLPAAGYWISIAMMCVLAGWCFLSMFH